MKKVTISMRTAYSSNTIKTIKCQLCGAEIVKNSNNHKYCPECAHKKCQERIRKWHEQHREKIREAKRNYYYRLTKTGIKQDTIKCQECGKETAKRSANQKYCPECAKERHRRHALKWQKNHPERARERNRRAARMRYDEVERCASSHNNCFSCPYDDCIKG